MDGGVAAKKLTLEEYYALPKEDRTLLRRIAFGAVIPPQCFVPMYDIADLKAKLIAENEATGTFPERWVDQDEDDEAAYFLGITK